MTGEKLMCDFRIRGLAKRGWRSSVSHFHRTSMSENAKRRVDRMYSWSVQPRNSRGQISLSHECLPEGDTRMAFPMTPLGTKKGTL
jgi:hypothetical protein